MSRTGTPPTPFIFDATVTLEVRTVAFRRVDVQERLERFGQALDALVQATGAPAFGLMNVRVKIGSKTALPLAK